MPSAIVLKPRASAMETIAVAMASAFLVPRQIADKGDVDLEGIDWKLTKIT